MGYVGERNLKDVLVSGLKRLEYRGYDSAGIAYFEDQKIKIIKSEGKLQRIQDLMKRSEAESSVIRGSQGGLGHTRWATHGKPTTQNAHPHRTGPIVLVHNGIIENYREIKKEIESQGYRPESETDSELFGYLVWDQLKSGKTLVEAVRTSFRRIEGACSVVILSEDEPGVMVGIRNGSPLVVAKDPEGGILFASDAQALIDYSKDVVFTEIGDLVVGRFSEGHYSMEFYDTETGKKIDRNSTYLDWTPEQLDKQGYPHYMLKEIFEQPVSLVDTLNSVLDRAKQDPFPLAAQPAAELLKKAKRIVLLACGTSWHAALLGKYWIERWAKLPVDVELASEFRYRDPVIENGSLMIGISQSGETADTLAAIREVRKLGHPTLGITNVRGSSLAREAQAAFFTSAGPEIGVAATKTFSAQLLNLLLIAGALGREHQSIECSELKELFDEAIRLPQLLEQLLVAKQDLLISVKSIAKEVQSAKGFFFIGRGYSYPLALEGALKLKEIAYVHAEGYAAGELKHGPIAMIDEGFVVVVLAPSNVWREKTISNLQEVKSRGAKIIGIGDAGDHVFQSESDWWIELPKPKGIDPKIFEGLYPFLEAPVVQLLSYEIAALKGTDIDQPRNLAKSVTVE